MADVLTSTALPAPRLCLEVTESALIRDLDQAVRVLKQFKQSGVSLSLDDLGTGYSSLSYLKRLAVDSLKIDKSRAKTRQRSSLVSDANALREISSQADAGI